MKRPLDVGVIGAGTAGAAAALFLARDGHRVTVYERVPEPSAVGAGILLQPTGKAVLRRLGLHDAVVSRATPVATLRAETLARKEIFRLRYGDIPGGHMGYGLHRGVLFRALFDALAPAGVTLRMGVEVVGLAGRKPERIDFVTRDGGAFGPHELCVVADGARSQLHGATDLEKRVVPHAWGALWCLLRDPDERFKGELYQVLRGTREMVGALPTGLGPEGDDAYVSVFSSQRASELEAWRARGLAAWKGRVAEFIPALAPLLDQVGALEDVLFTRYQDVSMPRWHDGRVVYLGDAAHAMSPQLGQGANLALWDAMTLADECERHLTVGASLAAYSRARKRHLGFYQFATRWLTLFFQSDLVPFGWARDAFMPLVAGFSPTHTLMVRSMTGTVQGVAFEDPVPLDPRILGRL